MRQFDVYENPNAAQRPAFPYFVVLQHDLFDHLNTRLTLPLTRQRAAGVRPPPRLSQTVQVGGESLHLAPQLLAALPTAELKRRVGNLRGDSALLLDALDAVISGV